MKLEGIITPIVTPFHRDAEQSINYEATQQLIDHLIAKGVKGIFILGSNGEFHVIEEAEKIEFAEKVIQMVDHRVPVYVGTGACSTKETIRLSKKMEELGGALPFTDKAAPEQIKEELGLSKNAFKRAVGRLLKEQKIQITEKAIEFLEK